MPIIWFTMMAISLSEWESWRKHWPRSKQNEHSTIIKFKYVAKGLLKTNIATNTLKTRDVDVWDDRDYSALSTTPRAAFLYMKYMYTAPTYGIFLHVWTGLSWSVTLYNGDLVVKFNHHVTKTTHSLITVRLHLFLNEFGIWKIRIQWYKFPYTSHSTNQPMHDPSGAESTGSYLDVDEGACDNPQAAYSFLTSMSRESLPLK